MRFARKLVVPFSAERALVLDVLSAGRGARHGRASSRERIPAEPTAAPSLRSHRVAQGQPSTACWTTTPGASGRWRPASGCRTTRCTATASRSRRRSGSPHDADYLYFAFQCDDPEPSGIKTSITRRDNIWSDDWVGISLDALGTGQLSYHLMVNPSGVQLDMLNSVVGRRGPVARLRVGQRRTAERLRAMPSRCALPLQSIRFRGGRDVQMGILFWRRVSRTGVSVSWPALEPGKWVFEQHASLVFDELQPRLPREAIPSTTYARNQRATHRHSWGDADDEGDIGLSAKYGLTSTITLDATINPDFSQVESDAFQVEVNQRFPTFFSEKRPFFMEGSGIFTLAGQGNDNSLQRAVHTRRIVDPVFGAKVTGSTGRLTFGTLTALDQAPGRTLPEGDPDAGKDRLYNVVPRPVQPRAEQLRRRPRGRRGVCRRLQPRRRRRPVVAGELDAARHRLPARILVARAARRRGNVGIGAQAGYEYNTRRLVLIGYGEHYDRGLPDGDGVHQPRGDHQRLGIRRIQLLSGQDEISVAAPGLAVLVHAGWPRSQRGRRRAAAGLRPAAAVHATGLLPGRSVRRLRALGRPAVRSGPLAHARRSAALPLAVVDAQYQFGKAVFYDSERAVSGTLARHQRRRRRCSRAGGCRRRCHYRRVASIASRPASMSTTSTSIYSRTTYQFSRQFFIRGIAQFDSSRYRVLTDFLLVVRAAARHGRLRRLRLAGGAPGFVDGEWVGGQGATPTSQRGLFFKASYLHRSPCRRRRRYSAIVASTAPPRSPSRQQSPPTTAPTTLCQRKAILVNEATHATDPMPAIRPMNAPLPVARKGDGEDEHAENRSVEKRSEPVHDFDQRAELGRPDRHAAREQPPQRRSRSSRPSGSARLSPSGRNRRL